MTSRNEHGSATMLVLVLVAVLGTMAAAGVAVGGVLAGQRRAASAADLAALAAAEVLGPAGATAVAGASACAQAGRVTEANGARLVDCLVEGPAVVVEVSVDVPTVFGASLSVPGRARAGPAAVAGQSAVAGRSARAGAAGVARRRVAVGTVSDSGGRGP